MKPLVIACCLLSLVTACHATPAHRATPSQPPLDHTAGPVRSGHALGRPGCRPPSPITTGRGLPEVHGTSRDIQMWGLIMTTSPGPLRVDEDVKIVWRITGSGELHLAIRDPEGRPRRLQWGPALHTGSDYTRPGDEWGAAYRFSEPGCWTLRARRGAASANVWLTVEA